MRLFLAIILWLSLSFPTFAQFGGGGTVITNPTTAGANRVLCSIRGANFNSTADQACTLPGAVTVWSISSILVTNCSGTMTLAVGGVYPAASKAGTALVSAAQAYSTLSSASLVLSATLAANIATTRYTVGIIYLSLTVATGGVATCDFYVIGNDLT